MLSTVELDGPYITYGNLNAKLPGHLRVLSLTQGEELVNYLASLPEATVAWRDYLHEEMGLMALCRDNHAMCRRHKALLSDPSTFIYDQPLDAFERKLQRQLLGRSKGGLNARLNFQRMRAARRLGDVDDLIKKVLL